MLLGFIEGHAGADLGDAGRAAQRQAAVLENFVRYFGDAGREPDAATSRSDWAEERWTRGCYGGFTPPGVLLGYGRALRRPVGRIHWAGTETAT